MLASLAEAVQRVALYLLSLRVIHSTISMQVHASSVVLVKQHALYLLSQLSNLCKIEEQ